MRYYLPGQTSSRFQACQPAPSGKWARKFIAALMAASLVSIGLLGTAQAENCALDPSFGKGGIALTDFGGQDVATAAALQSDGKIVAAGSTVSVGVVMARYNSNGTLDNSFGNGGKVIFTNFPGTEIYAIAVQSDGKIVVAGLAKNAQTPTGDFVVARFNANGSLDDGTSGDSTPGDVFGAVGVGMAATDFFGGEDFINDLAIQPDGKIVAVGTTRTLFNSHTDFALARYNTDGSLDDGTSGDLTPSDSFGSGGKAVLAFSRLNDGATSVAIQPNGKIVVGGSVAPLEVFRTDFALARYQKDGTLDPTFGSEGTMTTDFDLTDDGIVDIDFQSDGKIVAAGYSFSHGNGGSRFALVRYNTDGSPDQTFGSLGQVVTDLPNLFIGDIPTSMAIQPSNDKIVVAGFVGRVNNPEQMNEAFAVVRYNPNGHLDTSFDEDGMTFTDIRGAEDEANAVLIQPDGNIVAVGTSVTPPNANYNFALVRYLGTAANYTPTLDSLTLATNKTPGGSYFSGTVKLCGPAPAGGLNVSLRDTFDSFDVPGTVTVPAGSTLAFFTFVTRSVRETEAGNIIAKLGTITRSAPLLVQKVGIEYVTGFSMVVGPNQTQGLVRLNGPAPAGGIVVTLSSKNPAVASPTASSLFIPEGVQEKSFTVRTSDVPSPRSAIITATANGTSKSWVLQVN